MIRSNFSLRLLLAAALPAAGAAAPPPYSFEAAQAFLKSYCLACHQGKSRAGGFDLREVSEPPSLRADAPRWIGIHKRVRNGEMPPKGEWVGLAAELGVTPEALYREMANRRP